MNPQSAAATAGKDSYNFALRDQQMYAPTEEKSERVSMGGGGVGARGGGSRMLGSGVGVSSCSRCRVSVRDHIRL